MRIKWILFFIFFLSAALWADTEGVMSFVLEDKPRNLFVDIGVVIEYLATDINLNSYLLSLKGEILPCKFFSARLGLDIALMSFWDDEDDWGDLLFAGMTVGPEIALHLFDRTALANSTVVVDSKRISSGFILKKYTNMLLQRRSIVSLRMRGDFRLWGLSSELSLSNIIASVGISWTSISNAKLKVIFEEAIFLKYVNYNFYRNIGVDFVLMDFDVSKSFEQQVGLRIYYYYGDDPISYFGEAFLSPITAFNSLDFSDYSAFQAKIGILWHLSRDISNFGI